MNNMTNKFLTTIAASAVVGGVAIVKTGLPTVGKAALIIYPGRSGGIRIQNTAGVLSDGKYILITQTAGGNDSLILHFDNINTMPGFIAGDSGTVAVSYTVVVTR